MAEPCRHFGLPEWRLCFRRATFDGNPPILSYRARSQNLYLHLLFPKNISNMKIAALFLLFAIPGHYPGKRYQAKYLMPIL